MSAVTLEHMETDVEPKCSVVFGGGRLSDEGKIDSRRIKIDFKMCYHARTRPLDGRGVDSIYPVRPTYQGDTDHYLDWLRRLASHHLRAPVVNGACITARSRRGGRPGPDPHDPRRTLGL